MTKNQTFDGVPREITVAIQALTAARQFIVNGVDLGFIRMPDAETPDPAHGTVPMLDKALGELRALLAAETHVENPSHWADQEGNTITAELKAYNESRGGAPNAATAAYTVPLYRHPLSPVVDRVDVPVELASVVQQLREGAGFWSSCSGCHESEDGHPMGDYIYSAALECTLGAGCSECGGLGAVWDNADYEGMIQTWLEDGPMPEQQVDVTMINAPRALLERIETWMPEHCQDLTDLQALLNAQPTASPAPTINAGKDTTCNQ